MSQCLWTVRYREQCDGGLSQGLGMMPLSQGALGLVITGGRCEEEGGGSGLREMFSFELSRFGEQDSRGSEFSCPSLHKQPCRLAGRSADAFVEMQLGKQVTSVCFTEESFLRQVTRRNNHGLNR